MEWVWKCRTARREQFLPAKLSKNKTLATAKQGACQKSRSQMRPNVSGDEKHNFEHQGSNLVLFPVENPLHELEQVFVTTCAIGTGSSGVCVFMSAAR